jgi:hypothetical protein
MTPVDPTVHLLELDPDLGSAIQDGSRHARAVEAITAVSLTLAAGRQLDIGLLAGSAPFGVLLLDGFVVRELSTAGRVSADLVGPEDVAAPRPALGGYRLLPHTAAWTALTSAQMVLLDGGLMERLSEWPEVAMALVERATRPAQRLLMGRAIATLPSVDARLLSSLWAWASDWATVVPAGVMLPVPLSHERLGRLIGAQRQTVTTAIGRLREGGFVDRRSDGAWMLTSPTNPEQSPQAVDGLTMPILQGMLAPPGLGVGSRRRSEPARTVAGSARDVQVRLAEQRVALRMASARNEEMLRRLVEGSSQLKAETNVLNRLARDHMQIRNAMRPAGGAAEGADVDRGADTAQGASADRHGNATAAAEPGPADS